MWTRTHCRGHVTNPPSSRWSSWARSGTWPSGQTSETCLQQRNLDIIVCKCFTNNYEFFYRFRVLWFHFRLPFLSTSVTSLQFVPLSLSSTHHSNKPFPKSRTEPRCHRPRLRYAFWNENVSMPFQATCANAGVTSCSDLRIGHTFAHACKGHLHIHILCRSM